MVWLLESKQSSRASNTCTCNLCRRNLNWICSEYITISTLNFPQKINNLFTQFFQPSQTKEDLKILMQVARAFYFPTPEYIFYGFDDLLKKGNPKKAKQKFETGLLFLDKLKNNNNPVNRQQTLLNYDDIKADCNNYNIFNQIVKFGQNIESHSMKEICSGINRDEISKSLFILENNCSIYNEIPMSSTPDQEKSNLGKKLLNSMRKISITRSKTLSNITKASKSESSTTSAESLNKYGKWSTLESKKEYCFQNVAGPNKISYMKNVVPFRSKTQFPLVEKSVIVTKFPNDCFGPVSKKSHYSGENAGNFSKYADDNLSILSNSDDKSTIYNNFGEELNVSRRENQENTNDDTDSKKRNDSMSPDSNLSHVLVLREILELATHQQQNETNLKHLISKYIEEPNLKQELLSALQLYSKEVIESDTRTNKLINNVLLQQMDSQKLRITTLQNLLDDVVQHNRQLENDLENLKSVNENLIINLEQKVNPDVAEQHEELNKNNEKLRAKIKSLLAENESLQQEMKSLRNQKEHFVDQLTNTNTQIRKHAELLESSLAEQEIEKSTLMNKVKTNEEILRQCVQAGDVLIEDLESLKRQFDGLPVTLNWAKYEYRGSSVADLFHISRACINELTRELFQQQKKLGLFEKDFERQSLEINKLNEDLKRIKMENEELSRNAKTYSSYEHNLKLQSEKTNTLQLELAKYKKEFCLLDEKLKNEKNNIDTLHKNIKSLENELAEKTSEIRLVEKNRDDILKEKNTLSSQYEALQKLLDESNMKNLLENFSELQESCAKYQSLCALLEADKKLLIDNKEKLEEEMKEMIKYQDDAYTQMQLQRDDIDALSKQNTELKEQLIRERKHLLDQTCEIAKSIENSNIVKTIQKQLDSELSRNQLLETNALSVNLEANRLALAAEYNTEVCKQLKSKVEEKEEVIMKLQSNLQQLAENEKALVADKETLTQRLADAYQHVNELRRQVDTGNQELLDLAALKDASKTKSDKQIQELRANLEKERNTLNDMKKEQEKLIKEKQNLYGLQKDNMKKLEKMKLVENKLMKEKEKFENKYRAIETEYAKLSDKFLELHKMLDGIQTRKDQQITEYERKLNEYDKNSIEWNKERTELEASVTYLKCTSQKLHNEIDNLRTTVKSQENQMCRLRETISQYSEECSTQLDMLEHARAQSIDLQQQLNQSKSSYDALHQEYNNLLQKSKENEVNIINQLEKFENLSVTKLNELEILLENSQSRINTLEQYEERCSVLEKQLCEFENIKNELDEKCRLLVQSTENEKLLKQKYNKLNEDYTTNELKIKALLERTNFLNKELEKIVAKRHSDITHYTKLMEELTTKKDMEKEEMSADIKRYMQDLFQMNAKYHDKCTSYDTLKENYQKVMKRLQDAFNCIETESGKSENLFSSLRDIKQSTQLFQMELVNLKSSIEYVQKESKYFLEENSANLKELNDMKQSYVKLFDYTETLEKQFEETRKKLIELNEKTLPNEAILFDELHKKNEVLEKAKEALQLSEARRLQLKKRIQFEFDIIMQLRSEMTTLKEHIQALMFEKQDLELKIYEANSKLETQQNLCSAIQERNKQLLGTLCDLQNTNNTRSVKSLSTLTARGITQL